MPAPTDLAQFKELLMRVSAGEAIEQSQLVPFLTARDIATRQHASYLLAGSYARAGDMERAANLALRAFELGRFNVDVFDLCYNLLLLQNRTQDLLAVTREAMLMAATDGNPALVYGLFSRFSDVTARWRDDPRTQVEPHADRIVAWVMERCFASTPPPFQADALDGRKIRVGFMLAGDNMQESALVRVALSVPRHHDRDRFEIFVYSMYSREVAERENPKYAALVAEIESWGCTIRSAPHLAGLAKPVEVNKMMRRDRLDIAVFNMLIRDYYILALLRPAPVLVGFNHGNPRGFTMRHLDAKVCSEVHGQMEALTYSYLIDPAIDFDLYSEAVHVGPPLTRAEFGVPDDAVLIVSGAQSYKFNNPAFWATVTRVLEARPRAVWLVGGVTPADLDRFQVRLPPEVALRVRLVPWRTDYVSGVLPLADVVVDTFPAGGAFALFWAMRLGKPCLSFRSNYFRPFSNRDWSPGFRALGREGLALPYGDTDALAARLVELIDRPDLRQSFGQECRAAVANLDDTRRYVREIEAAFIDMLRHKKAAAADTPPAAA